jgi:hypothetical protein
MSAEVSSILLTSEAFRNRPRMNPGVLVSDELFWSDHQKWLEERGYMLRQRYLPGWVPSWQGTKKIWFECEDGKFSRVRDQ